MFRHVCHLSRACPSLDEAGLDALVAAARARNRADQITGLLAHGGGWFVQFLEGPRDNVGAALARLRRDPRHHAMRIVMDEAFAGRDFAGEPLAIRRLDASLIDAAAAQGEIALGELVAAIRHETPFAVWREPKDMRAA